MATESMRDPTKGRWALAATAVALVLVTAGCSDSGGSHEVTRAGDAATTVDEAARDDAGRVEPGGAGSADLGADGLEPASGDPVAVDVASVEGTSAAATRDRIFTANLEIEVEVLEDAVDEASAAVGALGGFSANEEVDLGERRHATVTYRVPADRFDEAVEALGAVGDLQTQQVDAQDVTAQYADLEGRVTTLRTSIARLQGFLAETTDVTQIASLEGELTRREAELESTESQRRALADSIELSTITVAFTGSEAAAPVSRPPRNVGSVRESSTGAAALSCGRLNRRVDPRCPGVLTALAVRQRCRPPQDGFTARDDDPPWSADEPFPGRPTPR